MRKYKSDLLRVLHERGYIHEINDPAGLDALASRKVIPAYIGFDATAASLHVGSLVQIMMLRRLQHAGHKPVILMGGGTTKVGDPSGKDESRKLLSNHQIAENIRRIRAVFKKFVRFGSGPTDAILLNNAQWLDKLKYIDFLRDVGQHFTINRMLTFESVRQRLKRHHPLTFLEFNYMILQAYDFLELSRRLNCQLQMGGSDQWGNILNGIELGRRLDTKKLYGLTSPLITTSDGAKMGKTAKGAVWLDANLTKPYEYWQFWRDTADRDVPRFIQLFTELPLAEVRRVTRRRGAELNRAKEILASEATAMLHGRLVANRVARTSRKLAAAARGDATGFGTAAGAGLPILVLEGGYDIELIDALVRLQFVPSRGEAKRRIAEGAVKISNKPVTDPWFVVPVRGEIPISLGKKKHGLLKSA